MLRLLFLYTIFPKSGDFEDFEKLQNCQNFCTRVLRTLINSFIFVISEEIYDFDDPPVHLTDKTSIVFWYLNKNVRDVLKSPAWKNRLKSGSHPYFCVHNGFCRYFEDQNGLEAHFQKNPAHKLQNFEDYVIEYERRISLRQNSYMNKIKNNRSERSPTPTNSVKSNSSCGSNRRSISPISHRCLRRTILQNKCAWQMQYHFRILKLFGVLHCKNENQILGNLGIIALH